MESFENSRLDGVFGAALGLVLLACGQSQPTNVSSGSVADAYDALIGEVASCAKQLTACVSAADGDEAAVEKCREVFAVCREAVGRESVNALADATRSCTQARRECQQMDASTRDTCQDSLRACLQARPSGPSHSAADGGAQEPHGAPVGDCLDTLHACVEDRGEPNTCAREVRGCVLASVPVPDHVVPGGPSQAHDRDAAPEHEPNGSPQDAGARGDEQRDAHAADAGKPADRGAMRGADAADGGAHGMPPEMQCLIAFQGCMDADGAEPRDCAKTLRDCRKR